jgi:hypothetical protein
MELEYNPRMDEKYALLRHFLAALAYRLFFVEPRNQQALVDVLVEATESVMKHLPGFIAGVGGVNAQLHSLRR